MIRTSPWARFSKKLCSRIDHPRNGGAFSTEEAFAKAMRLAIGMAGDLKSGNLVYLYLLVDELDGIIADAKFQAFGSAALIGAADIVCELVLRKNYDQASRISAELIDNQLRDRSDESAFPEETYGQLNLVLDALEDATDKCHGIPFEDVYVAPPISNDGGETTIYPGWEELTNPQKISVIEKVIENDIRPYIELDAGGIEILDFKDNELIIGYQGACTSCPSSTGATLNAIQQILRNKVWPEIRVTPDMSFLNH